MSDFPNVLVSPLPNGILSTIAGKESQAAEMTIYSSLGVTAAAVWPAQFRALYFPVVVATPITVTKMSWYNGSTINGNVDVGIYDEPGNRLVSTGMQAQSGASTIQIADITDTSLRPGVHFLAINSDSATATFFRTTTNLHLLRGSGVCQELIGTPGTLPATATFAAPTGSFVPCLTAFYAGATF